MTRLPLSLDHRTSPKILSTITLSLAVCISISIVPMQESIAVKIMTVGDFDCSDRSLQTMNSILSYLKQNKIDRFIFLGDIDYRNHIDLRTSYSVCGEEFFERAQNYTELKILRGNHENNTTWKNEQIIYSHINRC
jgi:hypothetical protein